LGVPWDVCLGPSSVRLRSSAIRDLLAVTSQPDVISFAGGLPAPELFPIDDLRASFDAVLRADGAASLQYGPTEGHRPLREYLASRLSLRGIAASPDEILITSGSQQGLDLLGAVLLDPRVTVLIEAPSYVGALQAFGRCQPRFQTLTMDEDGLCTDELWKLVDGNQRRGLGAPAAPAVIYSVPTFQNPSGVTMSLDRRRRLLEFLAVRPLPLIEDDPYGELRFDGRDVPPLRALPGGEDTIYLGTFSKILAPGLRLGWVVAPRPVIDRLVIAKQGADLHTDSLVQRAVLHYCRHADLEAHISRLKECYRLRRDAMRSALERHFPSGVRWTRPEGGLFFWVTLPRSLDSQRILADAVAQKVAFVPGTAFQANPEESTFRHCLRLNFSNADPARIEVGIRRLAEVVGTHLEGTPK